MAHDDNTPQTESAPDPYEVPEEGYPDDLQCSFCQKHRAHVRKIIAGPTLTMSDEHGAQRQGPRVYICDECVWLCVDVLREDGVDTPMQSQKEQGIGLRGLFRLVFGSS